MTTDGELDSTFCSVVDQKTGRVLRRSERLLKLKEFQSSQDIFAYNTETIPLNQQASSQLKDVGESSQRKRSIGGSQCTEASQKKRAKTSTQNAEGKEPSISGSQRNVATEATQKKRAKTSTQNAKAKEPKQLESSQSRKPLQSTQKNVTKRSYKKKSNQNAVAAAAPASSFPSAARPRGRHCKNFAMPQLQCYNDNALLRAPFLHRPQHPQQSFLPTAYPHYFQERIHSATMPQALPPPPPQYPPQMHPYPRLPPHPMDAGYVLTPETSIEQELDHILNTRSSSPSSLSMPESLRGVFETDNLRELLRIDPVLYRLTDRHVQALAYALHVEEKQLRRLIRGIMHLPHQFIERIDGCTQELMDEVLEGILTQAGKDTPFAEDGLLGEDVLLRNDEALRENVQLREEKEADDSLRKELENALLQGHRYAPQPDDDDDDSSVVSVSPLHSTEMRLFSSQLQHPEKRQQSQRHYF